MGEAQHDTVEVNGVRLTREQVEGALKALNEPKVKAGDLVTWPSRHNHKQFIVIGRGALAVVLFEKYGSEGADRVRITDGITSWTPEEKDLIVVGHLSD